MASVTSLGLHQPTGLQYAIQERLLPPDPPTSSYSWHSHVDGHSTSQFADDELLVTPRCVVWSRGGVFRKCYRFDLENEPVTQALLTTFPSVRPLAAKDRKSTKQIGSITRSDAIVVFLKTQAHVYFIAGTSHVIHLPFEVESASPAPNGIIIQRKLRADNSVPASLKFPRVPPNSFVSSQPQPWSAASSQQSTFSIADLGAPRQLHMPPNSTLKDLWDPPALKNDSNWPRLFSLTDPLAEMGLVVIQPPKSDHGQRRRSSTRITYMDTAEEIVHISRRNEFSNGDGDHSLVLALTLNKETSMYTVWKLSYVGTESPTRDKQRATSGTMSRRRSSFVPVSETGATTPVQSSQHTRESLGVKPKTSTQDDESRDQVADFVSTLDPDFENSTVPRRKSRRVSSMLARADLSASHERSAFTELASGHHNPSNRRGESMGSQNGRTSTGNFSTANGKGHAQSQFNLSINSYLEAPVDDLLDELRAGGDFEGFHNMGLNDEEFDGLRQEIVLTKVCAVPAEHSNVRYSSQHVPAKSQCRIFTLTAPPSAADDSQENTIVICILDPDEKRLLVLTLLVKTHKTAHVDLDDDRFHPCETDRILTVSLGLVRRAKGVIDASRIDDGVISRILVLTETPDGYGELTLQAPWSELMKVPLPAKFAASNIRNLSHDATPQAKRDGGFKRVLSQGPRGLRGLRNSKPRGLVDLVDDEGKVHQLQLILQPRNPQVCRVIEVCRAVVPGTRGGEGVLVGWWHVMQWLRLESITVADIEWTAIVITIFSMVLGMSGSSKDSQTRSHAKRKSRTGLLRSSSGAHADMESWDAMQADETSNSNPCPPWAENRGWRWLGEESVLHVHKPDSNLKSTMFASSTNDMGQFIQHHVKLTRDFIASSVGKSVLSGCLPTSASRSLESRKSALIDTFVGLHLLYEEQKLDTMKSDSFTTGAATLSSILAQFAKWFGWASWVDVYDAEHAASLYIQYDVSSPIEFSLPEPFPPPSIYEWIQICLTSRSLMTFPTLSELVASRSNRLTTELDQWSKLTPRTLLFAQFFTSMRYDWAPVDFVEALSSAGMDTLLLETLPEAVLAPLQEAIVQCQAEPPTAWSKALLAIVGREDVNILLTPGLRPRNNQSSALLV